MNEYGHEWEDLREYLRDFWASQVSRLRWRLRAWWRYRVLKKPLPPSPSYDLQSFMARYIEAVYSPLSTPLDVPFVSLVGLETRSTPVTFTWDTGDDLTRPENT